MTGRADDGAIFLAGADRSGIGLVGELLDAHPDIAVARRTNLWPFYYGRFGDLADPDNLDRCLAEMARYRRIRDLDPDYARLRRDFRAGAPSYARLFALLLDQHRVHVGALRWCDKSLDAERHAGAILAAYPTGRMVHVLRDPRDRYASVTTHRGRRRGGVAAGVGVWLRSHRLAEEHRHAYPYRYLVVRYEDLVTEPERTLRAICAFVDVPLHPAMLGGDPGSPPSRRFTTASIGRYRRDLSEREIAWIQAVAGRRMTRCGYEHASVVRGWLRRRPLGFPVQACTLLLWQAAQLPWLRSPTPSARRLVA